MEKAVPVGTYLEYESPSLSTYMSSATMSEYRVKRSNDGYFELRVKSFVNP